MLPLRVGDEELGSLLNAMARSVGADGFVRQQHAVIGRPDSRAMLASITCPTVVICGRQDQVTPLELSEEMAALVSGALLVVIEDCGHMSPLERPQEVSSAMADWLTKITR